MKIRKLDLSNTPVNIEHQELGIPPVEQAVSHLPSHPVLTTAIRFASFVLASLTVFLLLRFFLTNSLHGGYAMIVDTLTSSSFLAALAVGFMAQLVDGALGMAYGITATTFLLSTGASPAVASASVHIAEIFTTGFSGIAHAKLGNVNKHLFLRLLIPGIIGAVAGAIVVTRIDGALLKPYVSAYLLAMGLYILSKAIRHVHKHQQNHKHVAKLAVLGGFIDSAGGGGWGPVVTSSLLGSGNDPRTTIGSVNFAEFFLTLCSAATFMLLMGTGVWVVVAGLVLGGLFAAPLAALIVSRVHARTLLMIVGVLISLMSCYNLYQAVSSH